MFETDPINMHLSRQYQQKLEQETKQIVSEQAVLLSTMSLTEEKLQNIMRYCLLNREIIGKHLSKWFNNVKPSAIIKVIELSAPNVGGFYDIYYNSVFRCLEETYIIRFYIKTIYELKGDWMAILNQMLARRDKMKEVQKANHAIVEAGQPIPLQVCPTPFNTSASNAVTDVYMLIVTKINESELNIPMDMLVSLFADRQIHLVIYDSTITLGSIVNQPDNTNDQHQ